jgi:hypothetical protein
MKLSNKNSTLYRPSRLWKIQANPKERQGYLKASSRRRCQFGAIQSTEAAMQLQALEVKRTEDGSIDFNHYARNAQAERRAARTTAMKALARGAARTMALLIAFVAFWNIPPLGSIESKGLPYR